MNAQVKIILACVFSIATFCVDTWTGLALLAVLVCASYAVSKVPFARAAGSLKPVAFVLLCVIVFAGLGALLSVGNLVGGSVGSGRAELGAAVLAGVLKGLFAASRIAALVMGCSLLTFTTQQLDLVRGLNALVRPLSRLHVPVGDVSMVVSMALRFVPLTIETARGIASSQRARGALLDAGSPMERTRAWGRVLVPLVVGLFRRAGELGTAMDARCYSGMQRSGACATFGVHDALVVLAGCAVLCGVGILW